jgi:hypothetical protein
MKLFFSLFITLIFFNSILFAGGPWTQKQGEGIVLVGVSPVIYSSMSSNGAGRINLNRRVSDITTQTYVEYGIKDKLTFIGNLSLKYVGTSKKTFDSGDFLATLPSGKLFGLGNITASLKYNFVNKKVLFSGSAGIETANLGSQPATGLRTGLEAWTFVPMLHFGQGFGNGIYYFVEAGYGARNKFSDDWRVTGEFGYQMRKPLTLAVNISLKQSVKNRSPFDEANFRQTGLYLNNQEYMAWSFKFTHELNENWGWNTALAGGFRTEFIARTPVISAGFYYKWKPTEVEAPQ